MFQSSLAVVKTYDDECAEAKAQPLAKDNSKSGRHQAYNNSMPHVPASRGRI